jgi:hypothetical protein
MGLGVRNREDVLVNSRVLKQIFFHRRCTSYPDSEPTFHLPPEIRPSNEVQHFPNFPHWDAPTVTSAAKCYKKKQLGVFRTKLDVQQAFSTQYWYSIGQAQENLTSESECTFGVGPEGLKFLNSTSQSEVDKYTQRGDV